METRLDRAIGYAFPNWGARRALARAQIDSAQTIRMMYDGAARGARAGFRSIGGSSQNSESLRSLHRLRDVSRDLDRNNAIAQSCRSVWTSQIVGAGIEVAVTSPNARIKDKIKGLIEDHLATPAVDFDGRCNFDALQALIVDALVRDGEVLIVRYTPPASLRLAVPMQVRVLEVDYLDATRSGALAGGNVCFEGIEFDPTGRRVAYWLYDEHPGGGVTWKFPTSQRVEARDVSHIYRVDRPGQMRGIPWCAPVIVPQWDLKDYEDAELMRQKIAACFAVFVVGQDTDKSLAQKISSTEKSLGGTPVETVEPGMITRLPNGVDVKFASPPTVTGFKDVTTLGNRKIATGYGVPYELATGDLSNVSFISGRLGMLKFGRDVERMRWHVVIPHGCAVIGRWFLEASGISLGSSIKAKLGYSPPRREFIDPQNEIPAIMDAIRGGLSTRSEENRKSGYDPEEIEREQQEDARRADQAGLRFDSDGRFPKATRGMENVAPAPIDGKPVKTNAAPPAPAAPPAK